MSDLGLRKDPLLAYRFLVEIRGLIVGGFEEVSGLEASIEVEELLEGGENQLVHRLPKGLKHGNLVLKRGLVTEGLWSWFEQTIEALNFRKALPVRTVHIIILDLKGEEAFRLACEQAYPVKWSGPELKAKEASVAVESLELVYHHLRRF